MARDPKDPFSEELEMLNVYLQTVKSCLDTMSSRNKAEREMIDQADLSTRKSLDLVKRIRLTRDGEA